MIADTPKRYGGSLVYVFRIILPVEAVFGRDTRAHHYICSVGRESVFAVDVDNTHAATSAGTACVSLYAEKIFSVHSSLQSRPDNYGVPCV